jgi:hypothetical protein
VKKSKKITKLLADLPGDSQTNSLAIPETLLAAKT